MKVDALTQQTGKAADKARKGKLAVGFEALLHPDSGQARASAPRSADEKKSRPVSGTEEALLVSRTLSPLARPAPLFDTKSVPLKDPKPISAPVVSAAVRAAVTVEHLATRAKALHEPARVTAPQEKKPSRGPAPRELPLEAPAREGKKTDDAEVKLGLAQPAAPQSLAAEPFRLEAPTALRDAQPLAPVATLLLDDPSARVVLMPQIARMSLDTGDTGRLQLQLKVRDGVTEVTAQGPAAPMLEARQGELRVALAKEGLALGHFDLTQHGSQHQPHERADTDGAVSPPTARRLSSSQDPATEAGRVHVKV